MMATFDHLLAAYRPRAVRAAVGLLGDEQEAAEVTQDAMLKAYAARDRYDPARPFYPWLYRIVRNAAFDALRRRKHRPISGLEPERHATGSPSALDQMAQREAIATVRRAMDLLGEQHREIIGMRHFQDLTYAEIGQLLELPQGTVMSRLFRARRALAQAIEEDR
jgi:RNA polymerase sigma-70 factor (ECF subfamily)